MPTKSIPDSVVTGGTSSIASLVVPWVRAVARQYGDGTIWLAYAPAYAGTKKAYAAYWDPWTELVVQDVPGTDPGAYNCACAVDSQEAVHFAYSINTNDAYGVYYRRRNGAWGARETVHDGANLARTVCIAVDGQDNVHVIMAVRGSPNNPTVYNIAYRRRTAAGWDAVEWVTDIASSQYQCSLAIDSQNGVHAAWTGQGWGANPTVFNLQYRRRTSAGWQPQEAITDVGSNQFWPCLCLDGADRPVLVWGGLGWGANPTAYNIRWGRRNGAWGASEAVTDVAEDQRFPALSVSGDGTHHVCWIGTGWGANPTYQALVHRPRNGTWGPVTTLKNPAYNINYQDILWAMWPRVGGVRTNIPATGYAVSYVTNPSAGNYQLEYLQRNLSFDEPVLSVGGLNPALVALVT